MRFVRGVWDATGGAREPHVARGPEERRQRRRRGEAAAQSHQHQQGAAERRQLVAGGCVVRFCFALSGNNALLAYAGDVMTSAGAPATGGAIAYAGVQLAVSLAMAARIGSETSHPGR